jgi:hypothetical protein
VASLVAGEVTCFEELDAAGQWQIRQALLLGAEHAPSLAPEIGNISDLAGSPVA